MIPRNADRVIPTGRRRHRVTVQNPGTPTPDGDGGYITTPIDSPIPWNVSIDVATARDLENITAGTVTATISHIVSGPWRADVNTHTSLKFNGRILNCTGVSNPEERNITLVCVCVEVEETPAPPASTSANAPTPPSSTPPPAPIVPVPMSPAWENL